MKWIHIGDLHIGKYVHEFSMLEDQKYILNQIIEIAKKEEADGIIIAGDIYDRSIPPAEAVEVLDSFLTCLIEQGIIVCMISGNHDSPERIGFAGQILNKSGLYIANTAKNGIKKICFQDKYGTINVYLLPFARPAVMNYWLQKESEKEANYGTCIRRLIDNCAIDQNERNILVTHHFVVKGGEKPICSDSEQLIFVGGSEQVDGEIFDAFDYVALGHIHRPQKVGRDTMRYCGSPLKYSFSEANYDKSVTVVELKEKENIIIKEVPLKPLHDMRIIKGRLEDLMNEKVIALADCNDYIQAVLTDKEALYEPMDKLRSVYPNIMQMVKENNIRRENEIEYVSVSTKRKTSFELYKEFYRKVTNCELDERREHALIEMIENVTEEEKLI